MTDTAEKAPESAKLAEDRDRKEIEDGEIVDGSTASGPQKSLEAKHALEHGWTFWFDNQNHKVKQVDWASSLRSVYTFKTVEDFWCLFNNVLQPSQLVNGADFHCFKEGIEPKWEDPKCAQGGKWSIASAKGGNKGGFPSDGKSGAPIDNYWLHTLLAMIGEQFDDYDEICGAVVSVRTRQDRLALWTKTASNETAQLNIGKQWKQVLDFNEKIPYVVHDDAKRLEKNAKSRYTV